VNEVIWFALSACILGTVVLCSPPVVRALSKRRVPRFSREPPTAPRGLCLSSMSIPFEGCEAVPAVGDAMGRLVRMKVTPTGDHVFTLRHIWISADLGLPALGFPLDGVLRLTRGVVHSSVFAPFGAAALFAGLYGLMGLVAVVVFVADRSVWDFLCLALWTWFPWYGWRNAKRAARRAAEDAIAALSASQVQAGRRTMG